MLLEAFLSVGSLPHEPRKLPHDREVASEQAHLNCLHFVHMAGFLTSQPCFLMIVRLAHEHPYPKISALLNWASNWIFGARKACMMVIHTRNDHGLYLHLLECNNNYFLLLLYCVIKC